MNEIAVIIYHSDANLIYRKEWIDECIHSIKNQTLKNFSVVELNYSNKDIFYYNEAESKIIKKMDNHIEAMNFLLDYCFQDKSLQYVFNINLDDTNNENRFLKELSFLKENNYDLVSCEFDRKYDKTLSKIVKSSLENNGIKDIQEIYLRPYEEIVSKGLNVICHPGVLYTKRFWNNFKYYDNTLGYEDLLMWIKAVRGGAKIGIYMDESLLVHRVHDNNVGSKYA